MDSKEQKEHFLKMADIVEKAGLEYSTFLVKLNDDNRLSAIEAIETEGDEVEEELNSYYTTQNNIPYLSLDRARLLRQLDEVLDQILLAAKTVDAFGSALPSSFSDEAKELADHVAKLTKLLKEAVVTMYDDFKAATVLTRKIEEERDLSTNLLFELEKSFFNSEDSWKDFTAVSRITRRTISIVNAAKSASEIIEIMSMKYL